MTVKVVDMDAESVEQCIARGLTAVRGDALTYSPSENEKVACFNLILHHLVGNGLKSTRSLQSQALLNWKTEGKQIFVNEYIYESYIPRLSGVLIYLITNSKVLSSVAAFVSKLVPSFKANTFGVGVRFRAREEWIELFEELGFIVQSTTHGESEIIERPLRLLLIKKISRDSFLLQPLPKHPADAIQN